MILDYEQVMKHLYDNYYGENSSYSEVTSSHWREVGGHQVRWGEGSLELKGMGFGDRMGNDWMRSLYSLPRRMMLRGIVSDYPNLKWILKAAKQVAKEQGTVFSYDCLRQALSLAFIIENLPNGADVLKKQGARVCVVGDGYGYLTCLLRMVFPHAKIVEVNLGRTLLFDVAYTQKVFPNEAVLLLQDEKDCSEMIDREVSLAFLEAEKYHLIEHLTVDLFVNIASMQEMNLSIVQNYFQYIRSSKSDKKFFYCCNRIEKFLPDGEVIRFAEYDWRESDNIISDELCPWYQKFPVPYPPFWKPFDGPIKHRLIEF